MQNLPEKAPQEPLTHTASPEVRFLVRGRPTKIEAVIASRAYEIYVARGYAPGHELDDWLNAEADVMRGRINTLAM
jgi:hypothetical protein